MNVDLAKPAMAGVDELVSDAGLDREQFPGAGRLADAATRVFMAAYRPSRPS